MHKIEYSELKALGCSDKGLSFYNITDPLIIMRNNDGSYTIKGCIEDHAKHSADLCRILDSYADAYADACADETLE